MRITESRYSRDRLRHDLAFRLIGLEARTRTICNWTGLTQDRVRKLYRSYVRDEHPVRRRRGKSPRQWTYFLNPGAVEADTRTLAATLTLFAAIRLQPSGRMAPTLDEGHRLCDAYESYRHVVTAPHIEFEHAALLADTLARGDEIRTGQCRGCGALNIIELAAIQRPTCSACTEPLREDTVRIPTSTATAQRSAGRATTPEHAKSTHSGSELSRRAVHRPARRMA